MEIAAEVRFQTTVNLMNKKQKHLSAKTFRNMYQLKFNFDGVSLPAT